MQGKYLEKLFQPATPLVQTLKKHSTKEKTAEKHQTWEGLKTAGGLFLLFYLSRISRMWAVIPFSGFCVLGKVVKQPHDIPVRVYVPTQTFCNKIIFSLKLIVFILKCYLLLSDFFGYWVLAIIKLVSWIKKYLHS